MQELLTSAQMRALEQSAIDAGIASGLELMERAGRGAADAICARWPELLNGALNAIILCGPGNNGGDGFVIARVLKERGAQVQVLFGADGGALPQDARVTHDKWVSADAILPLDAKTLEKLSDRNTIIVDALFGAGLNRPVEGQAREVLNAISGWRKKPLPRAGLVAIDGPSGLCLDSGRALQKAAGAAGGYVPIADFTVTFERKKLGHMIADGPEYCGDVVCVDLGLGEQFSLMTSGAPDLSRQIAREIDAPLCSARSFSRSAGVNLGKLAQQHKFDHGHAVVVSGPAGRTGAARLAARAALRIGAGLVTIAAPREAMAEHAAQLNAIMLAEAQDAKGLEEILSDDHISAICIGPALGLDMTAKAKLEAVLESGKPAVLDADALTLVGKHRDLKDKLHGGCTLTPHAGEFARLLPDLAKRLRGATPTGPAFSKVDAARLAADELGATLVFKGADTVIALPGGYTQVHSASGQNSAPWLATAGSGDVLAGLITGLLARRFNKGDAEASAVWLHAEAGRSFGPGLIAEDIAERIPQVLSRLQSGV